MRNFSVTHPGNRTHRHDRQSPCWADVRAPAFDRDDETLLTKYGNSLPGGATGNAELLLQLRFAGHGPVRYQLPRLDPGPQDVCQLHIDRRGTLWVNSLPGRHG